MGENARMSANPTVLVIQHDPDTPLAALAPPLAALGVRTATWDSGTQAEPPEGVFDGVIVLGGMVNPDGTDGEQPLDREREVIAEAHARGVPVLGTCLGAQLIAQATEGSARRMEQGEVGWVRAEFAAAAADDALLAGVPESLPVLEWHNYECTPPEGAAILARSDACVQAFRVGATTWGLQFHVEVTVKELEEWAEGGIDDLTERGLGKDAILGTEQQRSDQLRLAARIGDRFARAVLAAAIPA
jgi:GMP synthase-like glutamine amidotransferase